jgi:hypothetical protein
MRFEAERLQFRCRASALRLCGVAIWPNLLWSALAWPSPRFRRHIVSGQTGILEVTANVRFGSKAYIARDQLNVRFTLKSRHQ